MTDRFCLLVPAEAHIEEIRLLAPAGVTQFNIYLMCGDEGDTSSREIANYSVTWRERLASCRPAS